MSEKTIRYARGSKVELEKEIAKLLEDFTDKLGLEVDSITISGKCFSLSVEAPNAYQVEVDVKL
jgi:membrane protease subunit (stomatin/prohibitin family)